MVAAARVYGDHDLHALDLTDSGFVTGVQSLAHLSLFLSVELEITPPSTGITRPIQSVLYLAL